MEGAEQRGIAYRFKLKRSANVKKLFRHDEWVDAGQTWEGLNAGLQLSGWSQKPRGGLAAAIARDSGGGEKVRQESRPTVELKSAGSGASGCVV